MNESHASRHKHNTGEGIGKETASAPEGKVLTGCLGQVQQTQATSLHSQVNVNTSVYTDVVCQNAGNAGFSVGNEALAPVPAVEKWHRYHDTSTSKCATGSERGRPTSCDQMLGTSC